MLPPSCRRPLGRAPLRPHCPVISADFGTRVEGNKPLGRAGTRVPPSSETERAYPVIGNQPPPEICCVQRSFLVPGKGGSLVGCFRDPPRSPRQAVQIPYRHSHRKKQHGPIQGDRKKKYSHRPNCRHTPTSAPHTPGRPTRHSLRAAARFASNKGPGGAKPKNACENTKEPLRAPLST